MAVVADLTKKEDCYQLFKEVQQYFDGKVDILINCAGKIMEGDIENTSPQDYDEQIALNLKAPFILTQLFFPLLQKTKGQILNVSADQATNPEPGFLSYGLSKAGLDVLTKSSALEMAPWGIRVNGVSPCYTKDTFLYHNLGQTNGEAYNCEAFNNMEERIKAHIPLHRVNRVEDVAKAIIFITSNE